MARCARMKGTRPSSTASASPLHMLRRRWALRVAQPDADVIATLLTPRFDPRRLLIVAADAPSARLGQPASPAVDLPVTILEPRPAASSSSSHAQRPTPGSCSSPKLFPRLARDSDGRPAEVVRAQVALMAVPVPPGRRRWSSSSDRELRARPHDHAGRRDLSPALRS